MKKKSAMTKKEYGKLLAEKFMTKDKYIDIDCIVKAYEMHNKYFSIAQDFISASHDIFPNRFEKFADLWDNNIYRNIYSRAKYIMSEHYPDIYTEKYWEDWEKLKKMEQSIKQ